MTSSMKSRGHVTKNDSLEVPGSSPGKDLLSKQARKESGHVEKCTVYQEILHRVVCVGTVYMYQDLGHLD